MEHEITVVTVDDHRMIRENIKNQIDAAPGMKLVGEGEEGDDVLRLVIEHKPDVLFLDVHMPQSKKADGIRFRIMPVIQAIKEISPETAVVVISMNVSHMLVETALQRGILGYLLKEDDAAATRLADVVRAVHNGTPYFSEAIVDRMHSNDAQDVLTKRQTQIMLRIAELPGLSMPEHAARLGITEGALRNHLSDMNRRLGVNTRLECFVECLKRGIITLNDG